MAYSFFVDYRTVFLSAGLRSHAGGSGRWLQGLSICLSRLGHKIDVLTPRAKEIPVSYENVTFIDEEDHSLDKKEYDVCFFNGWSCDEPIRKAKIYFYIEFFRNWEHARPLQIPFLKRDDCYVAYPFLSSATLFKDPSSMFADKSVFIPYPVYETIATTNNYHCNNWCISLKDYQWPHRFNSNLEECKQFLQQLIKTYGNQFAPFPRGDKPLQEVLDTLKTTRLLFPFSQSGSSLEAVANGTVSITIFKAEPHVQTHLPMGPSSVNSGIYQEYPINMRRMQDVIEYVLGSEENYCKVLKVFREEIAPNSYSASAEYTTNLIKQLI